MERERWIYRVVLGRAYQVKVGAERNRRRRGCMIAPPDRIRDVQKVERE
jgi:hypothetical protein